MKLGDNLPGQFLHMRKSALGVCLIEPKIEIYYLGIKPHAGSKISKWELTRVVDIYDEIVSSDSGLPKKLRRKEEKITHWKEG